MPAASVMLLRATQMAGNHLANRAEARQWRVCRRESSSFRWGIQQSSCAASELASTLSDPNVHLARIHKHRRVLATGEIPGGFRSMHQSGRGTALIFKRVYAMGGLS